MIIAAASTASLLGSAVLISSIGNCSASGASEGSKSIDAGVESNTIRSSLVGTVALYANMPKATSRLAATGASMLDHPAVTSNQVAMRLSP